jgi:ABC-type transport system involved in multi-copper enzyme maturation permease subunit
MSVVEACWAWCRDKVGWSDRQQSREELFSGAGLAVGFVAMALWGWQLPALAQVVLWIVLAFASAVLLRRGWLKLFGPVLFYDMVCQARRNRYFLLRMGYAALLIFFLFITYREFDWQNLSAQDRYLRMAESYFFKFIVIQFIAVALLTPAYVAGAIADEKERGTLEFMLATDLRNREIVLSKLVSRLANLTLFVLTGLPILSFLQFLGGIDPNLLLAGFLATFITMFSMAGFSIFASVHFKRSRDAVVIAYLGPVVYVALGWLGFFVKSSYPTVSSPIGWGSFSLSLADVIDLFNAGNLPLAFASVQMAMYSGRIEYVLWPVLRNFVIFHVVVGLGFTICAVMRLRVIALRQASNTPQKSRILERSRPAVWDDPVLWKEIYVDNRGRTSWLARLIMGILFTLTVGAVLWAMAMADGEPRVVSAWVTISGTAVACLSILGVSVRAACCITGERDKNTFDFLLTTRLDSDAILWAKFLGCMLSLRRPLIWLGIIWGLGVIGGALQIWEIPLLLVPILIYAAVFSMVGLCFSMESRSAMRATIFTVMSVVGISVGHWLFTLCCAVGARGGGGNFEGLIKFQAAMTPPVVIGVCHVFGFEYRSYGGHMLEEFFGYGFAGLLLYTVGGIFFWITVLGQRFREITNREPRTHPVNRSS